MIVNEVDLENCVIVELDTETAGDVEYDADQGTMLVIPTAIRSCEKVDRNVAERIETRIKRL